METLQSPRRTLAAHNWWNYYLAWLASTPRNSIETELEPNRQDPNDRIRVIDHIKRQGTEYPTGDKTLWWTIICLDGAPERMHYWTGWGWPVYQAAQIVAPAEERFIALILDAVEEPTIRIEPKEPMRDGVVLAYEKLLGAAQFSHHIRQECRAINELEQLPWNEQFHPRVGIALSVRQAFSQLLHARCDEIRYRLDDEGKSLLGGSEEEIQILSNS